MNRHIASAACAIALLGLLLIAVTVQRAQAVESAMLRADPDHILADARLLRATLARGEPVYRRYCADCHGAAARGDRRLGAPDLTDRDFLYGSGRAAEIEEIVRGGIRAHDSLGWDIASMPAFASSRPYARYKVNALRPGEIEDLAQFVLSYTNRATDPAAAVRGAALFQGAKVQCFDCHTRSGKGDPDIGAPDLTDATWLYGDGSHDAIYAAVGHGRAGSSPAFRRLLSPAEVRAVSVFVANLPQERRTGRATERGTQLATGATAR